jgi:hypothetical protein
MTWPKLDLVVGRAVTDHELEVLHAEAASSAEALSAAHGSDVDVEVAGFAEAQRRAPTPQERPHWCWAACLQAILRHYGVPRTQDEIVAQVYGMAVDLPELTPAQLYHVVNSDITLEDGSGFAVRGSYYPGALLSAPVLHRELQAGRPVMAVHKTGPSTGHAVVLYGARFRSDGGIRVKFFDPTPGRGLGQADGLALDAVVLRWFTIRAARRAA